MIDELKEHDVIVTKQVNGVKTQWEIIQMTESFILLRCIGRDNYNEVPETRRLITKNYAYGFEYEILKET
ncbi:MAG: hypothetical protein GY861_17250 [bacterium]|nr:hypothetical protein [bacterium]